MHTYINTAILADLPELLTSGEVAKLLKVSTQTVTGYIRNGELAAYRYGRAYRIAKRDLVRFLQQSREGGDTSSQAALVFTTPGTQRILATAAQYLFENLPADQQEGIGIVLDGREYSLAEYLNKTMQPRFDFGDGIRV